MKIICNHNLDKFSSKFAFIILLSFLKNQKQKSNFKPAVGRSANEKYVCFLFIMSCALFQSHGEFSRLL